MENWVAHKNSTEFPRRFCPNTDTFYGPLSVRITVHKVTNDDKMITSRELQLTVTAARRDARIQLHAHKPLR